MKILKKLIYNKIMFPLLKSMDFNFYKYFINPWKYPIIKKKLASLDIRGRLSTAKVLVNSNKSLSRYGDGELQWMLGNKRGSFEKNSPLLRKRLTEVIKNQNNNFMVALPDAFISLSQFNKRARKLWARFVVKYSKQVFPYLSNKYTYYDTSVVRPYIDYKNKSYAKLVFNELKKIWDDKNILIVEGIKTRLGVGNDLFNNAKQVKRVECPVKNAFESYHKIYNVIITFLKNHKDEHYITLLSLGPTATVMAYDISGAGYRSLDIGHIDLEYSWYLMGVSKPVNLINKYNNESNYHKDPSQEIHDKEYLKEIIGLIK